jgi:polysaccharide biosynthesis transport protein
MLTWADIWSYVRALLRWWPILILATTLASGTAWFLARQQPDSYQARASLMVGNNFEVSSPNSFAVDLSNSLAKFYEVLLRREVILKPVAEQMQLPFPWQLINEMLYTEINPRANLLEVYVTDSNPERAAALANSLAERLISYSPNAPEKVAAQQAEVDRQLNETQASLSEVEQKIKELEQQQASLNAAVDLRENQQQLDELEKARERFQETYNGLFALRNNSSANTLQFFERAEVPQYALPQKRLLIVGAAGMGGLLLAIIAVLLIDRLDPRWRNGRELQERIGIVHLGSISFRRPFSVSVSGPQKHMHERAVRDTHTRMTLEASDRLPRLLLVSSPEPSESRSAYVIELANVYAQAGHRVLLVDAELARPHVSRLLSEQSAAQGAATPQASIERWSDSSFRSYNVPADLWLHLRPTPMANVALLPSRARDDDGLSVLVPSLHWPDLVQNLRNAADVVIFDGPSALTGADAALLAPLVDGVVLAVNPKHDTLASITETKNRLLRHQGTRLLGAVILTAEQARSKTATNLQEEAQPQAIPSGRTRRTPQRFALSVDKGGITLTLPRRKTTRQLVAAVAEPVNAERPLVTPGYSSPTPADAAIEAELLDELRSTWRNNPTIVTPPPAPTIVTPPPAPTIVTPPPFEAQIIESEAVILEERAVGEQFAAPPVHGRKRARVAGQTRKARQQRRSNNDEAQS